MGKGSVGKPGKPTAGGAASAVPASGCAFGLGGRATAVEAAGSFGGWTGGAITVVARGGATVVVVAVAAAVAVGGTAATRDASCRSVGSPIATAITTIPIAIATIATRSHTDILRGPRARVGLVRIGCACACGGYA
jgi:hypothetical protein